MIWTGLIVGVVVGALIGELQGAVTLGFLGWLAGVIIKSQRQSKTEKTGVRAGSEQGQSGVRAGSDPGFAGDERARVRDAHVAGDAERAARARVYTLRAAPTAAR